MFSGIAHHLYALTDKTSFNIQRICQPHQQYIPYFWEQIRFGAPRYALTFDADSNDLSVRTAGNFRRECDRLMSSETHLVLSAGVSTDLIIGTIRFSYQAMAAYLHMSEYCKTFSQRGHAVSAVGSSTLYFGSWILMGGAVQSGLVLGYSDAF